jgi:hypothetical protein
MIILDCGQWCQIWLRKELHKGHSSHVELEDCYVISQGKIWYQCIVKIKIINAKRAKLSSSIKKTPTQNTCQNIFSVSCSYTSRE